VSVSTTSARRLRIGEVAEATGVTTRTIRYYEEIGLLESTEERAEGKHRLYSEADVERVREVIRLRDLLGLSLDELRRLVAAESARAALRREWRETEDPAVRRRLLEASLAHIADQLDLVRKRRRELERLDEELVAKRKRARQLLAELG
jgi:MerR family transcriptional regulator, repressor of the yfmOP operon